MVEARKSNSTLGSLVEWLLQFVSVNLRKATNDQATLHWAAAAQQQVLCSSLFELSFSLPFIVQWNLFRLYLHGGHLCASWSSQPGNPLLGLLFRWLLWLWIGKQFTIRDSLRAATCSISCSRRAASPHAVPVGPFDASFACWLKRKYVRDASYCAFEMNANVSDVHGQCRSFSKGCALSFYSTVVV